MLSDKSQVKVGIVLSYLLIILNTIYGLFLTPYILGLLGEAEYGVYKTISSLSSSLMVLDLGIGGTVMRYVSHYNAKNEKEKIPNFVAMNLIQAGIICGVVFIVSAVLFFFIGPIYSNTFTVDQIQKAKILFSIFVANMLLHIIENVINGIITGCNHFGFGNGIKICRLLLRIALVVILLRRFSDSITIALIDLVLTFFVILIELYYIRTKLQVRIKYSYWDKTVFFEAGKYTVLMFLTSIAAQVNNNLDNVIIGAISGPALVAIYSFGLLIFSMYENLSTSVSGVMLPTVTNVLEADDDNYTKTQELIVKVGRIQFLLLGAAIVGFACIGKDFIHLWLGNGYEDVYVIALILMIPSLFELCVNVCLSILRAKNMLGFRTVTLFASTALNAVVTVVLVKTWSYVGAAFGTAASFIIGSLIIMNVYYKKRLGLPMVKIYGKIVDKIWICLLISGGVLFVSSRYIHGTWISFVVNVLIFCAIYGVTLLSFGLNEKEKRSLPIINRFYK